MVGQGATECESPAVLTRQWGKTRKAFDEFDLTRTLTALDTFVESLRHYPQFINLILLKLPTDHQPLLRSIVETKKLRNSACHPKVGLEGWGKTEVQQCKVQMCRIVGHICEEESDLILFKRELAGPGFSYRWQNEFRYSHTR